MLSRAVVCFALSVLAVPGADWNPRLAAQYLDSRQKEWFDWPTANSAAKPCVSCHTGMTYLLARPALRKALGEEAPTAYETGLLASLRSRVDKREPANSQGLGVESIMAARFLATADAYDRMWALQLHEGPAKGAWNWFSLELDPWETPESRFYGAAMAAMSVPAKDHGRPEAQELIAYLTRERAHQPLHHRLMLLWASTRFPSVLPAAARLRLSMRPGRSSSQMAVGPRRRSARSRHIRTRRTRRAATPTPLRSPHTYCSRPRATRRTPNLRVPSPGFARIRMRSAGAGRLSP
jgi:hypothetical protein